MRCGIYIRKSRKDDKPGYRLQAQRDDLPKYAVSKGWKFKIYDDGHASAARGKADSLEQRSELINDIQAGLIDVVLCMEYSRLSRDESMADYVAFLSICVDNNVKLATAQTMHDPSQDSDWFMLLMEGGFSAVEMRKTSRRMAEGYNRAHNEGQFLGGVPPAPYVYSRIEQKPVIVPDKKPQYLEILTLAKTYPVSKIAEKFPQFSDREIRRILEDRRLLYYASKRINSETGEYINCIWEPLITLEDVEEIKKSKKSWNARGGKTTRPAHLLTGLGILRCGYCGKSVKSYTDYRKKRRGKTEERYNRPYYICTATSTNKKCPEAPTLRTEIVDAKVIQNLVSTLAKQDAIEKGYEVLMKKESGSEKSLLESQLKELEVKKHRIVKAISEGVIEFADAREQVETVKSQISAMQNRLANLETPDYLHPDDLPDISLEDFDLLTFAERREIISLCIKEIKVYSNNIYIEYNFPTQGSGSNLNRIHMDNTQRSSNKIKMLQVEPKS